MLTSKIDGSVVTRVCHQSTEWGRWPPSLFKPGEYLLSFATAEVLVNPPGGLWLPPDHKALRLLLLDAHWDHRSQF